MFAPQCPRTKAQAARGAPKALPALRANARPRRAVAKKPEEAAPAAHKAAALALAAILAMGAGPDEAMAARSSGRVGGSAFRSAPRSAPRSAGPRRSGPTYNTYVAPPLMGYGVPVMPGFGYGYGFGMPLFGGGFVFQLMIGLFVVNAILNVIANAKDMGNNKDDDDDFYDV